MAKRTIITLQRSLTAAIWLVALYLLFFTIYWYLAAAVLAIHLVEYIVVGRWKGSRCGYTSAYSFVMTLLFGYSWWLFLEDRK